jgi:hypothetical protein
MCLLHRLNKRPPSKIRHSIGSDQAYQSLLGSAITLRLLALMPCYPITAQSETKAHSSAMALRWCYG